MPGAPKKPTSRALRGLSGSETILNKLKAINKIVPATEFIKIRNKPFVFNAKTQPSNSTKAMPMANDTISSNVSTLYLYAFYFFAKSVHFAESAQQMSKIIMRSGV